MPSSRPETILVVDDEPHMVQVVRLMLESEGYSVLSAAEGHAALELARKHPGTIELLLTDMVMPRMSGRELASLFRIERPAARVLSMSAYLPDTMRSYGVSLPETPFLQKPFTRESLARRVRQLLDTG